MSWRPQPVNLADTNTDAGTGSDGTVNPANGGSDGSDGERTSAGPVPEHHHHNFT